MTREEAIDWLKAISFVSDHNITEALDMAIESLQTDRPTGVWDFNTNENNGKSWNICSNCGHSQFHKTNYCPSCGAVMLVPIQPMEIKGDFHIDDDYKKPPQILGNVEVVVRCKDCKHWASAEDYDCEIHSGAFGAEDFCSYGERKGGEEE